MTTRSSSSTPGASRAGRTGRAAAAARLRIPPRTETADDLLTRIEYLLGRDGRLTLQRVRRGDWQASTLYARGGHEGDIAHGETPAQALAGLLRILVT